MRKISVTAAVALALATVLGGCAASKPERDTASSAAPDASRSGEKKSWLDRLTVEPAPDAVTPAERDFRRRPGLLSGKDGELVVYQELDTGSADPGKPAKVRR